MHFQPEAAMQRGAMQSREPLFSVVIPTYNRAGLITQTLDSLCRQTCTDFEVLVVDDGSQDDTVAIVQARNQARVLRQANQGAGAARNLGSRNASGRYIAFLDSDDLWFPWTLEVLKQVALAHEPGVILTSTVNFHDPREVADRRPEPVDVRSFDDFLSLNPRGLFMGSCALVVRADSFEAAGCFAEHWMCAEDLDLSMRMGLTKNVVVISKPPLVAYRKHAIAQTQNFAALCRDMNYIMDQEAAGAYPGGGPRRRDRLVAIGDMLRHAIARCVAHGHWREAASLYRRAAPLFLRIRRWRSLVGLPLLPVVNLLRRTRAKPPSPHVGA